MGQRYFEHAAVVAEGEPEQFCGTYVALTPVGAGDQARRLGQVAAFEIRSLRLKFGERNQVDESRLSVEHQVAVAEQHEEQIGIFFLVLFVFLIRLIDVPLQWRFVIEAQLGHIEGFPMHSYGIGSCLSCGGRQHGQENQGDQHGRNQLDRARSRFVAAKSFSWESHQSKEYISRGKSIGRP